MSGIPVSLTGKSLNNPQLLTMNKPLFGELVSATLERAKSVQNERAGQYGDTWRNCRWLILKAVLRELGVEVPDVYLRAIALASFDDMKYERFEGGYKEDNLDDGINYSAALAEQMRRIKDSQAKL